MKRLIDAKLDGSIDEVQAQRLSDWIAADLDNAIEYSRCVRLHSQLRSAFIGERDTHRVEIEVVRVF